MKHKIEKPDDVFDDRARRSRKPRSGYGTEKSIAARPAADAVTEAMNRLVDRLGSNALDAFVSRVSRVVLKRTEWQ